MAANFSGNGNRERFLQRVKETVDDCFRLGTTDAIQKQMFDSIRERLNNLCRDVERSAGNMLTDLEANEFSEMIGTVRDEIEDNQTIEKKTGYQSKRLQTDENGHYKYDVPREQLDFLSRFGFTAPMMSEVLGVSESTVRRRLRNFNISLRQTTVITDENLDQKIIEVTGTNRRIGPNSIRVRLAEKNIFLPRQRVRDGCSRVDPGGCALRSLLRKNIQRRTYKVAGPNSLWHFDGNHKLIRWNLVVHGCIDGYSRLVTFLKVSNNNKALTVFNNFIDAIRLFGTPSRVRCDYGVENVDVCTYMEGIRGINRGSAIKGKSCHNQRIERLWVDVWDNVSNEFYDLFSYMELKNIFDITNEYHLYALHYVFLPRINERLKSFAFQYNNHPVSTEHNRSPNQLFIQGVLANSMSNFKSIEELIQDAGSTNDRYYQDLLEEYGVEDNNDDVSDSENNADAIISVVDVNIPEDKRQQICEEVNPLSIISSLEYGEELFKITVQLLDLD
ncbi:uncharacterized protein LOC134681741 [Mytilus trossulus]|uniref:uncharacterized protein LOC134681741 n=1 Tax=Mytilus trossulus TaxID=6551 RepID=UPI0030065D56